MNITEQIMSRDKEYVAGTYNRYNVAIKNGEGAVCYDYEGKKYIDFTSGIGVNSLGFSNKGWVKAVTDQLNMIQHTSNLFYTDPCSKLAKTMCQRTGMKKMFFSNSGAEANEGAIKTARKYSEKKYNAKRHEIITIKNSFHGRTLATVAATAQDSFHKHFTPLLKGFVYVEANNLPNLEEKISVKTCAVMMELVQGEGGVNNLDTEFVKEVARICQEKDLLLIIDEVQTGIGRTGEFMAFDHYEIKPDIVTVAKGIGGGLPIGGILFGEKTENTLEPGEHGSTFGGNPVVCAGANYILEQIDDQFVKSVKDKGNYIKESLLKIPEVAEVSGLGLMLGVKLKSKDPAAVVKNSFENGLLILTAKNKLRLLPPLIISKEEIDRGIEILQFAVK